MMLNALLLLMAALAANEPVTISARLEPPEIPYYREALLIITVEAPAGLEVSLPDLAPLVGELGIEGPISPTQDEPLPGNKRRMRVAYRLDAAQPGEYPIQPIPAFFGDGGTASAPGLSLHVRDVTSGEAAELQRFAANFGPMDPPNGLWRMAAIALLALLLGGAAMAGWLLWRKRSTPGNASMPETPWDAAHARLQHLLAMGRSHDAFYVELSDILRQYIEARFGLRALEETTPEFLDGLATCADVNEEHHCLLAAVLRQCDRVKFAQYAPSLEDMRRSHAAVARFVHETIPVAKTPMQGEAA